MFHNMHNSSAKNPFRGEFQSSSKRVINQQQRKEKEWGKEKFKPKSTAELRIEAASKATPWKEYKLALLDATTPQQQDSRNDYSDEKRRQKDLDQRRARMEQQRQQSVKWENFNHNHTVKPLVDEQLLENFDGRNLSIQQNNSIKRTITKFATKTGHYSLAHVVNYVKSDIEKTQKRLDLVNEKKRNLVIDKKRNHLDKRLKKKLKRKEMRKNNKK